MHKFSLSMLLLCATLAIAALTSCGDTTQKATQAPVTSLTAEAAATTQAPVTTVAPKTTVTTEATTTATVTTTSPIMAVPEEEPISDKVTLDAEMDALYTAQSFHFPTTPLYIYSTRPENRGKDAFENALSCRSSGVLDFCYDGDYLWYFCTIYDTTMFDADREYVLTDHNPWQTDSIEVWYSFDGKKLLHVDVDAWGLRLFTDDKSTSVHFDEVIYKVKNDRDAGVWYAEIGIPAKDETGTALKSGDTVYIALQINDLMTDFKLDPSRSDNLAFNGGHYIDNFKTVVLP